MAIPRVHPAAIDMTVFQPRIRTGAVELTDIPSAARLTVATTLDDVAVLHLKVSHLTVYEVVEVVLPDDSFPGELPPGIDPEPQVVQQLVIVTENDGTTPVDVAVGHIVKIEVAAQELSSSWEQASGTLVITGDTWESLSVPLRFERGSEVSSDFHPLEMSTRQGGLAVTTLTARLVSGPAVDVEYHMIADAEAFRITMEPEVASLRLQPGETQTLMLAFRPDRDAPVGRQFLRIVQTGALPEERMLELHVAPFSLAVESIRAKAAVLGEGPPGTRTPLSDVEDAGRGGFVQRFSSGNIYWHPALGAKWVYGAILVKYRQLGGPSSTLGYPRTDEKNTSDGHGRMNEFTGGDIYFSPQSGAQAVQGPILAHWKSLAAERSYLGYPTFDQRRRTTFFEHGAIHVLTSGGAADISDAREIKTGVIHVDGAAANGWAELVVTSLGGWTFKGSMRSTGALSYDVLMTMTIDLQRFGGPIIAFAEKGDVEGTLVLGGNRAHTWDHVGSDDRLKAHWDLVRTARVTSEFKVDFGPGDLLALLGSVLGAPIGVIALIVAGSFAGNKHVKACPVFGKHEHFNPESGRPERDVGVYWVSPNQECPDADDVFDQ